MKPSYGTPSASTNIRLALEVTTETEPIRVVCREDKPERLFAELSVHGLDLVLADAPTGPAVKIRAFQPPARGVPRGGLRSGREGGRIPPRLPPLARRGPRCSCPRTSSALRRSLEQWFDATGIRPRVVAEFDDSALLKVFEGAGAGVFPAPVAIEAEVCRQYGVQVIGRLDEVRERFYAISVERRLKHPAVLAISTAARTTVLDGT